MTNKTVDKKSQVAMNQKPKNEKKLHKRWTHDQDGTLGVAKSIASRFGEEIVEEEFFVTVSKLP